MLFMLGFCLVAVLVFGGSLSGQSINRGAWGCGVMFDWVYEYQIQEGRALPSWTMALMHSMCDRYRAHSGGCAPLRTITSTAAQRGPILRRSAKGVWTGCSLARPCGTWALWASVPGASGSAGAGISPRLLNQMGSCATLT